MTRTEHGINLLETRTKYIMKRNHYSRECDWKIINPFSLILKIKTKYKMRIKDANSKHEIFYILNE